MLAESLGPGYEFIIHLILTDSWTKFISFNSGKHGLEKLKQISD